MFSFKGWICVSAILPHHTKTNPGWVKRKEIKFYPPLGLMLNALHQQTGMITEPRLKWIRPWEVSKETAVSAVISSLQLLYMESSSTQEFRAGVSQWIITGKRCRDHWRWCLMKEYVMVVTYHSPELFLKVVCLSLLLHARIRLT